MGYRDGEGRCPKDGWMRLHLKDEEGRTILLFQRANIFSESVQNGLLEECVPFSACYRLSTAY
jgi:hypothetical protein